MPETAPAPEIPDVDLASFVLERADELGDKPALIDGPSGRTITYAQLDAGTRALAASLASRGIGKGDVIAIYMPNVPEYALLFHGAIRAGATSTTANPLYTSHELAHQLTDSGAKMLFTIGAVSRQRPDGGRRRPASSRPASSSSARATGATRRRFLELRGRGRRAARGRPRPGERHRRDPLLQRHDRAAEGRDAQPPQPDRERPPVRRGDPARARTTCVIGVLPFFHIYGQTVIMNARAPLRRDGRDDAALRPRAVPRAASRSTG